MSGGIENFNDGGGGLKRTCSYKHSQVFATSEPPAKRDKIQTPQWRDKLCDSIGKREFCLIFFTFSKLDIGIVKISYILHFNQDSCSAQSFHEISFPCFVSFDTLPP